MDPAAFRAITGALEASLSSRPEVLGLILLGSTADTGRAPDAHSDHDFFVVARAEHAERLRVELDWVPRRERLVLAHRETAHGLKLLFDDGHVMELAVFAPDELGWARGDRWRVVFAREIDLESVMRANAAAPRPRVDGPWLARQALFQLVVGRGRWRRGERLSGHRLVFGEALPNIVAALAARYPADGGDPYDALRRFERLRPELGARLHAVLELPADRAAEVLIAVLGEVLDPAIVAAARSS